MTCKNCGCELAEGMKFCSECGTKVTVEETPCETNSDNTSEDTVFEKNEVHAENAVSSSEDETLRDGFSVNDSEEILSDTDADFRGVHEQGAKTAGYGTYGANHGVRTGGGDTVRENSGAYRSPTYGYNNGASPYGQNTVRGNVGPYQTQSNGYNQGFYGNPAGNGPGMNQQGYGGYAPGGYNPNFYNNGADRQPTVKEYLTWMLVYPLLSMIPGVGYIIYLVFCFKHAFDDTYRARANFFKATLITMAVSVGVAILFFIFMFFMLGVLEETAYSGVFNEFNDSHNFLRMMLK